MPRSALALLFLGLQAGCSADAVPEPLPEIELPGTFIAREREPDGYQLFRTRVALRFGADRTYIFFDEHQPGARTLAEARSKARDPELLLVQSAPRLKAQFVELPYFVIWYRSMTDEERGPSGL